MNCSKRKEKACHSCLWMPSSIHRGYYFNPDRLKMTTNSGNRNINYLESMQKMCDEYRKSGGNFDWFTVFKEKGDRFLAICDLEGDKRVCNSCIQSKQG
jgi:hypothetical protein